MSTEGSARPSPGAIERVRAATVLAPLPTPIDFGNWVMKHREFALVRLDTSSGLSGFGFCLTRDGPVAEIIRRWIAPAYTGKPFSNPEQLFYRAQWSNLATFASGIGIRALSIVDLATWDLAAKAAGKSMPVYLGGTRAPVPVTAIIGYPPTLTPHEVRTQVEGLYAKGWRRFKQPIAATTEATLARLHAAFDVADDIWLGLDANWVFKNVDDAEKLVRSFGNVRLGWLEDIFPPGDAAMVAELRSRVNTPIAMGDEQGGSYHPEALLQKDAVDVVRVDATTNGGLTRLRPIIKQVERSGKSFSTHMFGHIHSQILAGLGYKDVPVEWGVRWTGVDQFTDSLVQPEVHDGVMDPLPELPGFGTLVNPDWIREQLVDDPDDALGDL